MSLQITEQSPFSVIIEKDGTKYLGFLSMSRRQPLSSRQRDENGFIWNGKSLVPWEINGITEHNRKKYVYGPWFEGSPLAVEFKSFRLEQLLLLTSAFSSLPENWKYGGLHAAAIVFGGKNNAENLLLLPPSVVNGFLKLGGNETRFEYYDQFNDLSPEHDKVSTPFAILAYKCLTGEKPFPCTSRSDLIQRMNMERLVEPKMMVPEIKDSVSEFITENIFPTPGKGIISDAAGWTNTVNGWLKYGTEQERDEEEKILLERQREKTVRSLDRAHKISTFWLKHKTAVIISAVAFVLVMGGLISGMKKATAPPYTLGKTPLEVVKSFFSLYNDLDHIGMENSTQGKAGKAYIDTTVQMYVIVKQQLAYGGESAIINAAYIEENGISSSDYGKMIWGITDLKVEKTGELSFSATYRRWYSTREDTERIQDVPIVRYFSDSEQADIGLVRKIYKFGKGKPEYYLIDKMDIHSVKKGIEYKF